MALTQTQVSQLYVSIFGRASEGEGNSYWQQDQDSMAAAAAVMLDTDPAKDYFGETLDDNQAFIEHIYLNTLGKTVEDDADGIAYWVDQLDAGTSKADVIVALINAAQDPANAGPAQDQFNNRVEVSNYAAEKIEKADLADLDNFKAYIDDVDGTAASVAAAKAAIDADADPVDPGLPSDPFVLTQLADNLTGTDGDDLFLAPVTQNTTGSGQLANTFETGDVLDGGKGVDVLRTVLIETGSIQDGQLSPAISATTTNIEKIYFTAQSQQIDSGSTSTTIGTRSTIDAGSMSGVEQWWTDESRSNIQIEDIRSRPQDTVFGMKLTDPNVGYSAFFNPLFLDGDMSAESALTLILQEITDGQAPSVNELKNITVREVNFSLVGTDYTLDTAEIRAANTWVELETAIAAELTKQGLDTLSVSHTGNGVFEINDTEGGVFSVKDGEALILGVASDIDTRNRLDVGRLELEGQTSSTLVLDGAGSGSQGGVVNIAAMSGDRGIEVMDVLVGRNSHIAGLFSENNPANTPSGFQREQMLEEVNVSHTATGTGTLQIGTRTVDAFGVSTTTDDRLNTNGLVDVRVFDASGFNAGLKIGASLTGAAFDKYLASAADTVQFSYLLGDAGSNLNLRVNNMLAGDVDFALDILGGKGADRINLSGQAVKQQTSVDGGLGENTLEVNTSTGFAATQNGFDIAVPAPATDLTAAETSFEDVSKIGTVVIGANAVNVGAQANAAAAVAAVALTNLADTTHDITAGGFGDVDNFVIATNTTVGYTTGGVDFTTNGNGVTDTRLINLNTTTQTVEISGKNQTLGTGNSDAGQAFGIVRFSDTIGNELDLTLSNTARATGALNVGALTIDNTPGGISAVRTLNLDSAGTRQTSNSVTTLNGNQVNTFNLEGSQNLTITNLASAANSTAANAANRDNLLVDASTLEGKLYLGVTGGVVTAIDAALGTNRTVKLVGTKGESDILNIRDGVTTSNATTISDFETIRFGDGGTGAAVSPTITNATNFNATNVADVKLYDLVDSNVAINLNNLRATENVQINADNTSGATVAGDVTLAAANPTTGSQVNVNFAANTTGGGVDVSFWGVGGNNLNVQDFGTINLAMGGSTVDSYDYNFELNLLANPTTGLVNARTLNITGGAGVGGFQDSLTLGLLDTALTRVDFSDYNGAFATAGWDSLKGTNATVVVNEFDFVFDVGGDNTVVAIPASLGTVGIAEQQTISFAGAGPGIPNTMVVGGVNVTLVGGEFAPAIAGLVQAAINGQDLYGTGNPVTATIAGSTVTITAALADGDVAPVTFVDNSALTYPGSVVITDNAVANVAASADIQEVQTLDFTFGPGFGDLADGESITLNFAGGEYVFTNNTGAAILEADIDNAIIADAANAPTAFNIATGGGNLIQLTATIAGDMPIATIAATDAANIPANVSVATPTPGDLAATNVTGFDLVTATPEYITAFDFNKDAANFGNVWQIDNFMAFEAGKNVDLSNQSIIDLRDLGVDSAADINVIAGDVYLASLNANEIAAYTAQGNYAAIIGDGITQIAELTANDTVVTSNEGLNYTILLTGVDSGDLVNENFAGIA